jgi:tetratricopeptide (TPR) repeat protein
VVGKIVEARALTERTGDLRSLALLVSFYAGTKGSQGDFPSYVAYCIEALRFAEETGDPVLIGAFQDGVIWAYAALGRFTAAEECYTRAVALLGDDPMAGANFYGISPLLNVTHNWLYGLVWMGRFGEAERLLTRAREVAKQHRQFDMLCVLEVVTVVLARLGGNVASPLDHARNATELAEKVGTAFTRVAAGLALGIAHGLAGEWPASVAALETALTLEANEWSRGRRISERFLEFWPSRSRPSPVLNPRLAARRPHRRSESMFIVPIAVFPSCHLFERLPRSGMSGDDDLVARGYTNGSVVVPGFRDHSPHDLGQRFPDLRR